VARPPYGSAPPGPMPPRGESGQQEQRAGRDPSTVRGRADGFEHDAEAHAHLVHPSLRSDTERAAQSAGSANREASSGRRERDHLVPEPVVMLLRERSINRGERGLLEDADAHEKGVGRRGARDLLSDGVVQHDAAHGCAGEGSGDAELTGEVGQEVEGLYCRREGRVTKVPSCPDPLAGRCSPAGCRSSCRTHVGHRRPGCTEPSNFPYSRPKD